MLARALPRRRAPRRARGTASRGSSGSRRGPNLHRRPVAARRRGAGLRALGRRRRARLPGARKRSSRRARRPARPARLVVARGRSRPDARLLGAPAGGGGLVGGADRHLAAPARHPPAGRSSPARTRSRSRSLVRRPAGRRRRLDGSRHLRRRARGQGPSPRTSCRSAASRRTRRSRSPSGCSWLVDALTPDDGFGAVLLVARPESDPVPGAPGARRRRAAAGDAHRLGREAGLAADRGRSRFVAALRPTRLELDGAPQVRERVRCRPPRASSTRGLDRAGCRACPRAPRRGGDRLVPASLRS